jgi:hypothetical protein
VLGAIAGLVLAVGCLAPTLPLPPPSKPDEIVGPDENGMVILRGSVRPRSIAHAFNTSIGKGWEHLTQDDGRYELVIEAQINHEIELSYIVGNDESQRILVVIPDPNP